MKFFIHFLLLLIVCCCFFSCQNSRTIGIAANDFNAKIRNEKQEFFLVAIKPIEFKIEQIPVFLRKYYSQERSITGWPNYASQFTISKDNKFLPLRVYRLSYKVRYIKIIFDKKNEDFALKIKHYFADKFPEIFVELSSTDRPGSTGSSLRPAVVRSSGRSSGLRPGADRVGRSGGPIGVPIGVSHSNKKRK